MEYEFESLSHATEVAIDQNLRIGTRVRVRGAPYVLDAFTADGPTWRCLTAGPKAFDSRAELAHAVREKQSPRRDCVPARTLPDDSDARKEIPLAEGVLFYFPAALAEVARVSKAGNDKHNPGQPMHHARGKSTDHADCQLRHMVDARESTGVERTGHLANKAWRALAELQEHCESLGAPLAPNARRPACADPDQVHTRRPCADPDKMHGACDDFGGSDC